MATFRFSLLIDCACCGAISPCVRVQRPFVEYLYSRTLSIDLWDGTACFALISIFPSLWSLIFFHRLDDLLFVAAGDTLMPIGTAHVPLIQFLRQQAPALEKEISVRERTSLSGSCYLRSRNGFALQFDIHEMPVLGAGPAVVVRCAPPLPQFSSALTPAMIVPCPRTCLQPTARSRTRWC